MSAGVNLVKAGHIEEAIAQFRKVLGIERSLAFDLEPKAKQLVASTLVKNGMELAKQGKIEEALTAFSQARQYDPSLTFDLEAEVKQLIAAPVLLEKSVELVKQGKIEEALATFSQAREYNPNLKINVAVWNDLCWFGSLWGHANSVMHTCERAVEFSPDDGGIQDSRGVARALTGNLSGASEDFRAYLEWAPAHGMLKSWISKRQNWLRELKAGRNPFDAATLEALRKDEP